MRYISLALLAALVAAPAFAGDRVVDFRGSQLGMSLSDWESSPAPQQTFDAAKPFCDRTGQSLATGLPTEGERALGVVRCTYVNDRGNPVGMRMGASEITGEDYEFLDGRLYLIRVYAVIAARDDIVTALTAKFGPASLTQSGTVRNGLGVPLPRETMSWRLGGSTIIVNAPDVQVDRMTVTYSVDAALDRVSKAERAAHPGSDTM